ncbi:MAG: hypothetical protein ACKOPT_03430 [Cyanobium sp.]|nr:hypothetical protein [Cyanobacteriota bacterium]
MPELFLSVGILAILGMLLWLGLDSDDDSGDGGLMEPVLVPVRVRHR